MKFKTDVVFSPVSDAFRVSARQLPYVSAITLSKVAVDAGKAVQKKMPIVFDRPTDFTLRGVYTRSASATKQQAELYIPDSPDEAGRAKREYIRPGAQGAGRRNQKKTEYLLTRMGVLPAGWVTTPGKGAKLDQYGNLGGSVYKQIINVLQIRGDAKPVSQRSTKGAKRLGVAALFFTVAPGANTKAKGGGWLPPGVWKHLPGGRISQILKFVKKASYKPRLNLREVAIEAVNANLDVRWRESAGVVIARFARTSGR